MWSKIIWPHIYPTSVNVNQFYSHCLRESWLLKNSNEPGCFYFNASWNCFPQFWRELRFQGHQTAWRPTQEPNLWSIVLNFFKTMKKHLSTKWNPSEQAFRRSLGLQIWVSRSRVSHHKYDPHSFRSTNFATETRNLKDYEWLQIWDYLKLVA
jgi:hypothetical protein